MKYLSILTVVALSASFLTACSDEPEPQYPQQPQQPYPQQPYPQQPYPQQPPAPAPYPGPAPGAPPAAPAGTGQPTGVPGVMKMPDGTCRITPPSLNGQPAQPMPVPCPPGV